MKSYSSLWIHCVWTTKDRQPLLDKNIRIQVFQFIKHNALENGYTVDVINGIEDHVHCLIRLMPSQRLSDLLKQIKGSSSRYINEGKYVETKFSWQVGYSAISVSPNNLEKIRKYIINQEKHHQHGFKSHDNGFTFW